MGGLRDDIDKFRDTAWRLLESVKAELDAFKEAIRFHGLEYYNRYYGPYMALVESNKDPEARGRVQLYCPDVLLPKGNKIWVLPMTAASKKGLQEFFPPEDGDAVWVFFRGGDFQRPFCYMGGWYIKDMLDSDLAPEKASGDEGNPPKKRGWTTPGGNKIILDDTDGKETIYIKRKDKMIVKLVNNKVSIGKQGGEFEPMMRGKTVKDWLKKHTHPHAYGPTGPPKEPFPAKGLSDDTETS